MGGIIRVGSLGLAPTEPYPNLERSVLLARGSLRYGHQGRSGEGRRNWTELMFESGRLINI